MPVVRDNERPPPKRRVPTQERSRRRVEMILDAAERLVLEHGVEHLTTRDVAQAAQVPVASLYQYFAAKEDVLIALAERHMAEMDEQVMTDLAAVDPLTVEGLVRSVMQSFRRVYDRRRAFVVIYLRGRTNTAVHRFGRDHNRRVARMLREFAVDAGIAEADLPPAAAELAVEIGDRVFQLAYDKDLRGDDFLVEEGMAMVAGYLEQYATPAGRTGVPLDR
ncbi:TetR/AcrR family transcriptional regulator [Nocardioides coralli]|uniref:TetR/AcrR family transcriptional regulator n=1 Tax=Nocardioides coralli TaxID=2872154 RepID=UPI001CA41768|nr:TetR/AcrR family transcriptional regulator [Nocardioides coralli]QZY28716.1 TetR/AcrR family transcriptional regulator [Nocardioides coralli]